MKMESTKKQNEVNKMNIKQFIKENRQEIDRIIRNNGGTIFNDNERELWILNHKLLYIWAKENGVRI